MSSYHDRHIENPWVIKRTNKSVDYSLWCHNTKCELFAQEKQREGFYEYDTGWGEANNDECNACLEPMHYYEPDYTVCDRCETPVLDDDVNAEQYLCEHCKSDLHESWQSQLGKDQAKGVK